MRAKCAHCQIVLKRPNDTEMKEHHQICAQRKSKINHEHHGIRKTVDIEYVPLNSISAMEIKAQKKRQNLMPGFKTTYVMTSNGLQRNEECQVCRCSVIQPSFRKKHRWVRNSFSSMKSSINRLMKCLFFP